VQQRRHTEHRLEGRDREVDVMTTGWVLRPDVPANVSRMPRLVIRECGLTGFPAVIPATAVVALLHPLGNFGSVPNVQWREKRFKQSGGWPGSW
jgi:hypothetical protein